MEKKCDNVFKVKKSKKKSLVVNFLIPVLILGILLLFSFLRGSFNNQLILQRAPVNPEFLKYLQDKKEGKLSPLVLPEGHWLGEIPSPLSLSHLVGQRVFPERDFYPSSYDLRTQGKLTPVKNQGACGSCWAFATYGSLESFLLPAETWDFSEQNLIDEHGFDYGPCDGGNHWMSTAYLARWSGPILESDDPYIYFSPETFTVRKHVQDVIFLPNRANYLDNDNI